MYTSTLFRDLTASAELAQKRARALKEAAAFIAQALLEKTMSNDAILTTALSKVRA